VLDRLIDHEPDVSREAPKNRHQILRELKEAVRRDLEDLLNTRQRWLSWPAHLEELKHSLVNYGIPDFTGAGMGAAKDLPDVAKAVRAVTQQQEPRFKRVRVTLRDNAEPLDRTLRFRIDALLQVDPAPEPVVFDSTLKPGTGSFEVKGAGHE